MVELPEKDFQSRSVSFSSISELECLSPELHSQSAHDPVWCRSVVNFINILQAAFAMMIFFRQKITNLTLTRKKLINTLLYKKGARKMWMKSTPEGFWPASFQGLVLCRQRWVLLYPGPVIHLWIDKCSKTREGRTTLREPQPRSRWCRRCSSWSKN